ncbi:hypothetical protein D2V17_02065 [Aurantiacibacter xanthus]|uniref:Uncharacterized protein n=1 Tax=Aurantiacibacter xanthus TaxID=1784712 RepID=A0A3A1PFE6_9SPHN|nr:hypothetical protein [Aurantiacibacter xanthus]RIV92252.1 hypothetical protein D2V17_02065 [Aurantiacibacter xanthus]
MFDIIVSIVMLAAAVLIGGGITLLRRGDKQRGMLMLILAFVMVANVAIWVIPDDDGGIPLRDAAAAGD